MEKNSLCNWTLRLPVCVRSPGKDSHLCRFVGKCKFFLGDVGSTAFMGGSLDYTQMGDGSEQEL